MFVSPGTLRYSAALPLRSSPSSLIGPPPTIARGVLDTMAAMVGMKSTGGVRGASQEGGEGGVAVAGAGDTTATTSMTTIRKSVSLGIPFVLYM